MKNGIYILSIEIIRALFAYVDFISNPAVFAVLTLISEVLNLFRFFPLILLAKIIIDMHRELIKIVLLAGINQLEEVPVCEA